MSRPIAPTPRELVLIRHGQSTANVTHDLACATGAEAVDIDVRDPDVPLSALGETQAVGVGQWLHEHYRGHDLDVWTSPYLRTRRTAELALREAGRTGAAQRDKRLRDKELGILTGLTWHGVEVRFPQEWARFQNVGKFYFRPPGGESWADLGLRARSFLRDLPEHGTTVVFTHDAMVFLFRYVCEEMDESTLLDLAHATVIGNCSITRLVHDANKWRVECFNDTAHLHATDESESTQAQAQAARPGLGSALAAPGRPA